MTPYTIGTVRRFCDYTHRQLEALAQDLELRMPPPTLALCASHYRTREKKRDPLIEELRFLDAVATCTPAARELALSELITNDPFVAEAYADMMRKRQELHPETTTPVTLGEALGMASAYLRRSGKPDFFAGYRARFLDRAEKGSVGVSGGDLFLSIEKAEDGIPAVGDAVILLHRGNLPHWRYASTVEALLHTETGGAVRWQAKTPSEGILRLLLPLCRGICFDLRCLAIEGFSVAPSLLLNAFEGYFLVALPQARAAELLAAASELGLDARPFATVMQNDRAQIICSSECVFSFETAFLRRLTVQPTVKAILPTEAAAHPDAIHVLPVDECSCPYLSGYQPPLAIRSTNGFSTSAAFCRTQGAFFRSALQTVTSAVVSLQAAGGDYTRGGLCIAVCHPPLQNDPKRIGELLAVILGIYRAQCELGMPASALRLFGSEELEHPTVTVFSVDKCAPLPSALTTPDASVHCVALEMDENGLPQFEALRALLRELSLQGGRHTILSASLLSEESATDGLARMTGNGFTCRLTDAATISGDQISSALLLESGEELPFRKIGKVISDETKKKVQEEIDLPSARNALNYGERAQVTLIANREDSAAGVLAAVLERKGARCERFDPCADTSLVARSILHSQLTVLAANATLPMEERIEFALRVQSEAGGSVLSFSKNAVLPEDIRVQSLEKGIDESVLAFFSK